jgi:hypothetical protein
MIPTSEVPDSIRSGTAAEELLVPRRPRAWFAGVQLQVEDSARADSFHAFFLPPHSTFLRLGVLRLAWAAEADLLCMDGLRRCLIVEEIEVELLKAVGVGQDVDFDDSAAPDRAASGTCTPSSSRIVWSSAAACAALMPRSRAARASLGRSRRRYQARSSAFADEVSFVLISFLRLRPRRSPVGARPAP